MNDFQKSIKISLDTSFDIDEICKPLKKIGLIFFSFTKIFADGSRIDLNNLPAMAAIYYLESNMYKHQPIESSHNNFTPGFFLWDLYAPNDESVILARETFNIAHGISYYEKVDNVAEICHFATHRDNYKILNFYLNNSELLKLFKYYFKEKAQKLILMGEKNKIKVISGSSTSPHPFVESRPLLLEDLACNRYYLNSELTVYITKRELECLQWLVKGKSAVEIAIIMNLSKRTVEEHIANIKNKLDCEKQSYLIKKSMDLGLIIPDKLVYA